LKELKQNKGEHQIEKIGADEIGLLQLSDSLFPTGMYTMSNGLETYFYSKKVRNASQIRDLIKVFLTQQIGPTDCVALGNSYEAILLSDIQKLIEIDQTVFAIRLLQEVRNASTRSGNQILKSISSFINEANNDFDASINTDNSNRDSNSNRSSSNVTILNKYQEAIKEGKASGIYPVALAVVSSIFGIPKHKSAVMMLYSFTASMIGASLRLGMLNHFDGQRIIHELKPLILETVNVNIDKSLTRMWQFTPEIDVIQAKHEMASSKMFIT
jgi:urease accessory protein